MYFENRYQAGNVLAQRLVSAGLQQPIVLLALNDGGVMVAESIAQVLKAPILLMVLREVSLPGTDGHIGTLDQGGTFTYDSGLSDGQVDEYVSEYHAHIEAEKIQGMHEINRDLSGQIDLGREFLRNKTVILISDGLSSGAVIDATLTYLKPVKTNKIVAAVPVASVSAVDRLHIQTDEIHVLSVKDNYLSTEHYYNDNFLPGKDEINQRLALYQKYSN